MNYIKSRVKVRLSLCLTKYHAMKTYPILKHHAMKTYWAVEVQTLKVVKLLKLQAL